MQQFTAVLAVAGEIDMRYTPNGKAVAKCLAAIPNWRKKEGAKGDFIRVVFWGKTAEIISKSGLVKGDKILVQGRLSSEFYDGKDGKNHLSTEVVVEEFEYMTPRKQAAQEPYTATPETRGRKAA